ncbi:MAG: protein translocase subunit SecD [Planctomycetota bacterium]|nr:protein translocase subunit SecD [Planctomycetota bacterium]
MENKNLLVRFASLIVMVVICLVMVFYRGLNQGIDLRGGYSLTYKCQTDENSPSDLSTRMINVLKERVDPWGLLNLEWTPLGPDRFEVRMRAAAPEVEKAKNEYVQASEALLKKNVQFGDVLELQAEAAASAPGSPLPPRCEELIAKVAGPDAALVTALKELAQTYRQLTAAEKLAKTAPTAALREQAEKEAINLQPVYHVLLQGQPGEGADRKRGVTEMVEAKQIRPAALQAMLGNYLPPRERTELAKTADGKEELDKRDKEFAQRLDDLRAEHPDRKADIEKVVALWKTWLDTRRELDDPADLKRIISKVGVLEFRIAPYGPNSPFGLSNPKSDLVVSNEELQPLLKKLKDESPDQLVKQKDSRYIWFPIRKREELGGGLIVASGPRDTMYVLLSNRDGQKIVKEQGGEPWALAKANRGGDQFMRPAVDFTMDAAGANKMSALTGEYNGERIKGPNKENLGAHMAILLDDEVYSAPTIQSTIHASGQITGRFSEKEVDDLVRILTAGSLPAKLVPEPVAENSFGPSLGQVNREAGMRAAIWGLVAVCAFMLVYYLLPGTLADAAVVLNLILTLGFMSMMNVTMTMAGIAGLILTMGMAVDANVLIYERLREEQAKGLPIRQAIKNAYERAFSAIFDSNLTTLITSVILGWIGSVEVRGFAITLGVGLVFSMFTALVVTRWIFEGMLRLGLLKKPMVMLKLIGVPNVDWIGKRFLFWGVSIVVGVIGMVALAREGTNVLGIEFSAGTKATIQFRDDALLGGKRLSDGLVESRLKDAAKELKLSLLADTAKVELVQNPNRLNDLLAAYDGKADGVTDHKVQRAEWEKAGSDPKVFDDQYDKNGDGVLDADEVRAMPSSDYQVMTTEMSPRAVREAVTKAFGGALVQRLACEFTPAGSDAVVMNLALSKKLEKDYAAWGWAPITTEVARGNARLRYHAGGLLLAVQNVTPAISEAELNDRIRTIRRQPDMNAIATNQFEVFPLTRVPGRKDVCTSFAVAVTSGGQIDEKGLTSMAQDEARGLALALTRPEAIPITAFDAAMAGESVQRAVIAIVLSWVGIVAYLWLRFGSMAWGLGAVVALIHDTIITVGMVAVSAFLSTTLIGKALGIDAAFKIDMVMVAAVLTMIGYSVNDTIVVFDRIRENRGKLTTVTPKLINVSINQTLSRTILTSAATLVVVAVMYVFGGAGIHGFNYALLVGIVFGTYSSIAIASPLLLGPRMLFRPTLTGQDETHVTVR